MERVIGIGGVFLRARRPEQLRSWYAERLGFLLEEFGGSVFRADAGDVTVWHAFPQDSAYLGEPEKQVMVNYRVRDLDAMLAQLRAAGVPVEDRVGESEHGRFGWATDPEGNRIELWEPPPGEYPAG